MRLYTCCFMSLFKWNIYRSSNVSKVHYCAPRRASPQKNKTKKGQFLGSICSVPEFCLKNLKMLFSVESVLLYFPKFNKQNTCKFTQSSDHVSLKVTGNGAAVRSWHFSLLSFYCIVKPGAKGDFSHRILHWKFLSFFPCSRGSWKSFCGFWSLA